MRLSEEYERFNIEINASVPYMVVGVNATRLMLSAAQTTSMQQHLLDWNIKYSLYISPTTHTDPVVMDVKNAYKVFYKEIQAIKLQLKWNKAITLTPMDYTKIGVHKNKPKRKRVPRPKNAPEVEVAMQTHLVCKFFVRNPKNNTEKKLPEDVHKIGRKMVIQPADLDKPDFMTYQSIESVGRTVFNIIFSPEQHGMKGYLMACYINPTGEEGPYSEPQSFLII